MLTNTIAVVGHVPGGVNGFIRVTDARKQLWDEPPPFPTYTVTGTEPTVFRLKSPKPRPLIEDIEEENKVKKNIIYYGFCSCLFSGLVGNFTSKVAT
jgi:hypothetical protein